MKTALTIGAAFLLTIASLAVGQTTPAKKAPARPSATGGPTKAFITMMAPYGPCEAMLGNGAVDILRILQF